MRLFVAAELPDDVRAAVDELERPPGDDVRWSAPASWHVTLRFLGEVGDPAAATEALHRVAAAPATASVGRTPTRVGTTAIALPVDGLDEVARAVALAFAGQPEPSRRRQEDERRRFRGHLTIGRLRRPGRWPAGGVGPLPAEVRWGVTEIALVRSHLGTGPARYEVLARHPLDEGATTERRPGGTVGRPP